MTIIAGSGGSSRNPGKWFAGLVLFFTLTATLFALALMQASAEGPAKETHERAIAALTEIDTLIERHYEDLQVRAEASPPEAMLQLREYPIEVPLTRGEALGISKPDLRALLLSRSADIMYADGTSALRAADGADSVPRFTAAGAVDRSLDLLRRDVHDAMRIVVYVLAAISLLLAVTLASLARGFGRLGSIGVAMLASGLVVLVSGALFRLMASTDSSGDNEFVRAELMDIGATMAMIPIRAGTAFALAGVAFVIVALLFARVAPERAIDRERRLA